MFLDLNGISHVIVDEAHERDMNIDMLLMLLKELIERNRTIRVLIMSATINPEIFQQYFNNCPLVSVPGFMYNVNTYYINVSIFSCKVTVVVRFFINFLYIILAGYNGKYAFSKRLLRVGRNRYRR